MSIKDKVPSAPYFRKYWGSAAILEKIIHYFIKIKDFDIIMRGEKYEL